ncbi:MAG TPA: type II secretion system protein [Gemmatimonadaceae bacterium]|nr:type II secretion system protein [Gemmatimonadaceae bacterium]
MTLLESVIAIVILSLTAIGVLGIFQQTSRAAADARAWTVATSYLEEGMESAKLGVSFSSSTTALSLPPGYSRQLEARPGPNGLTDVIVSVSIPGGAALTIHRLVRQ